MYRHYLQIQTYSTPCMRNATDCNSSSVGPIEIERVREERGTVGKKEERGESGG